MTGKNTSIWQHNTVISSVLIVLALSYSSAANHDYEFYMIANNIDYLA